MVHQRRLRDNQVMRRAASAIRIVPVLAAFALYGAAESHDCTVFVECRGPDLLRAAPELFGTQFEANQDRLDALLRTTGENLHNIFAHFAGVSAAEEIHEMRFESGMTGVSRRETFRYVAGPSNDGRDQLAELRIDPNTKSPVQGPAKNNFLVFGHFIDLLNYLLPQVRDQSRCRYLGRQTADGVDAFVVAFAQKPGATQLRSHIETGHGGQSAALQGLAWIDAASGRILRLRVDLLAEIAGLPLKSFSTEISLVAVSFAAPGTALWLPSTVTVHARYAAVEFHSVHRFSDYRTYPGGLPGNSVPHATSEDAWELLARGIALAGDNKSAAAVPVLRQALTLNPAMPAAHFHLADALRASGDFAGAEAELREAAREAPDSGPVHNLLGIVLFARGDLPGAIAEFRASVRLQPKDAVAHFNLGEILEKQGDAKTALDEYRAAASLAPDNARFKARLAGLEHAGNVTAAETTFKVDVRQVLIPVVVTDKQGHYVTGLKQADFKVLEDGVEQKISSFSVENAGLAAPTFQPGHTSPSDSAAAPPPPQHIPVRRTYLICVDSLHAEFSNLVHVREALTRLFNAEQSGDAQYIVVAVGRSMEIVQNATSDPEKVLQAIEPKRFQKLYLGSSKASMQAVMAEYRETLANVRAACDAGDPSCTLKNSLPAQADSLAAEERQYNMAFLSQLRSLVQQLARGTDRRAMVLISEGFGLVPGREAYQLLVTYFPDFSSLSLRTVDRMPELDPILRLAANSNIPIYTIDSRGLYTQEFYSAATAGGGNASLMPAIQSIMDSNASDAGATLSEIAAATGGTAFQNSNDILLGLQRAFADGRSYYMLAYVPSNPKAGGKFRAIQVQVRESKMVVSAKKGYWPQEAAQ